MNITEAKDYFPSKGTLVTDSLGAAIDYVQDFENDTVMLTIPSQSMGVKDLKELRKFLKLLISEMPK